MPVTRAGRFIVFVVLVSGCADPYEGGGRRTTLPGTTRDAGSIDPSQGGASGDDGASGAGSGAVSAGGNAAGVGGAFAGRY